MSVSMRSFAGAAVGRGHSRRQDPPIDGVCVAGVCVGVLDRVKPFRLESMSAKTETQTVGRADTPKLILAAIIVTAFAIFVMNILIDVIYAILDPRIRY